MWLHKAKLLGAFTIVPEFQYQTVLCRPPNEPEQISISHLRHPPNVPSQSQYTSYAPQYATHKPERAVTPATAHSGTYIHKPKCGAAPATAHSGTYIQYTQTLSVGASSNSSLRHIHIYTQTLPVEASSNSSLRNIYTHKPKRGTAPATAHSCTHKHINRYNTHT